MITWGKLAHYMSHEYHYKTYAFVFRECNIEKHRFRLYFFRIYWTILLDQERFSIEVREIWFYNGAGKSELGVSRLTKHTKCAIHNVIIKI